MLENTYVFLSCTGFLLAEYNTVSNWLTRQYRLYFLHRDTNTDEIDFSLYSFPSTPVPYSDFADRLFALLVHSNPSDDESEVNPSPTSKKLSLGEMFAAVHGGRNFYRGNRSLTRDFQVIIIAELISECNTCQKVRKKLGYSLPSENLHLKPPDVRSRIGFDVLTITPKDKFGNSYLHVCTEHFTKFMSLYPSADKSADSAMFNHYVTYGQFDQMTPAPTTCQDQ